jgi:hypothetical protein
VLSLLATGGMGEVYKAKDTTRAEAASAATVVLNRMVRLRQ